MEAPRLTNFSFQVGEHYCIARALSIGEWESLQERALPFLGADLQEEVIVSCLLEPKEFIDEIVEGNLIAGIPAYVFDKIVENSGFSLPNEEREELLKAARHYISTSVIDSMRVMILASGIMTWEQIQAIGMFELIDKTALAEQVLLIQQQNIMAALGGGQPLQLTWESIDPNKRKHQEAMAKMQSQANEIQSLLDSQTAMRPGRGMRMMPPDHLKHT